MQASHLYAALITVLLNSGVVVAADTSSHDGHPPSAGPSTTHQGGTGSKSMKEGVHSGSPGNLVTAAEGTVMTGHDADADGFVTREEASKNGDLAKQFAQLDGNRDGRLDQAEFNKFTPSESAATGMSPVTPTDAAKPKMR